MCKRPSRSLKRTVTALIGLSSVRDLIRSSWILWGATRFLRCSLAFKLSCSSSSYDNERKLRSSVDMNLLQLNFPHTRSNTRTTGRHFKLGRLSHPAENRHTEKLRELIKKFN